MAFSKIQDLIAKVRSSALQNQEIFLGALDRVSCFFV